MMVGRSVDEHQSDPGVWGHLLGTYVKHAPGLLKLNLMAD